MEVDQGKGKSRDKKGRSSKGKGERQGKSNGRRPGPVSCANDLTGLVIVLHVMVERASVSTHSARDTKTLHRFDSLTWNATSMIGSQVQVLLQYRFHPCRNLPVLTSTESSFSIPEPQCPWEVSICCKEFKKCMRRLVLDSHHIPCHHSVFPSRTDKRTCRQLFFL